MKASFIQPMLLLRTEKDDGKASAESQRHRSRRQAPVLIGSPTADVTLVGWGSTDGVIRGLGRGLVRFAFPKKDETFDVVEKRFDKLKTVG
jgi:hypothetical protein